MPSSSPQNPPSHQWTLHLHRQRRRNRVRHCLTNPQVPVYDQRPPLVIPCNSHKRLRRGSSTILTRTDTSEAPKVRATRQKVGGRRRPRVARRAPTIALRTLNSFLVSSLHGTKQTAREGNGTRRRSRLVALACPDQSDTSKEASPDVLDRQSILRLQVENVGSQITGQRHFPQIGKVLFRTSDLDRSFEVLPLKSWMVDLGSIRQLYD